MIHMEQLILQMCPSDPDLCTHLWPPAVLTCGPLLGSRCPDLSSVYQTSWSGLGPPAAGAEPVDPVMVPGVPAHR